MNRKMLLAVLLLTVFGLTQANAKKWKAKHVILIGIDGWGAYSVPKAHNIPNIRSLMQNGCYTLKKRCDLPSESAVNWSAMFNGACTEMHGYTNWNSRVPEIPSMCTNAHGIYPTIYSVIREQIPNAETGNIAEWDGIKYLIDSLAINYVDVASNYEKDDEQLCRMAEQYIKKSKPTFLAVCFDQVDHVGHAIGHDTPAYYDVLAKLDKQVGRIIQALKDAGIYDDTIVMMTSDHGGIGKGHGGKTLQEMEIPFIICGKNVKKGMVIKDVMMQFDTAATIAEVFNLKRPQAWRGLPIYSVFE
ncbi:MULTISPECIES: alkaline phosphatase [Prevotellaceae]|uniref:alkaline phosphatase n=1 Tax=Prevotellaceae TaxID=171552 RepID=UPI0003D2E8D3|nr:alkaline phosphatase [Prevotella phocaeensis]ETD16477.1 hypothetical protein HMPREF1199_02145 [Hoylesella oralis CC98A]